MKRKILLGLTILAFAAVIWGYTNINERFPASTVQAADPGEKLEFQEGILISVDDSQFLTTDEIDPFYEKTGREPLFESKVLDVTITLENQSQEEQFLVMTDLYIECTGMANGIPMQIVDFSEGYYGPLSLSLQPGEKRQIHIPYEILADWFSKSEWKKMEEKEFWLTYACYPVRKMLKLETDTVMALER